MREGPPNDALEALHLEMDGQLTAGERERLERYVETHPEARAEREALARLADALAESRAEVPADFASRVMRSLPAAGWESRHPRTWLAALAAVLVLLAGAVTLGAALGGGLGSASALGGAAEAIAGLFLASLTAGAGLLGASWKGVGLALAGLLGGSVVNWIAFGVLVVGLDLLLVRLLRRPAPARAPRGRRR
jgi:anti-sigma factor RsiW